MFINPFVLLPFFVFSGFFLLLLRSGFFARREAILVSGIGCYAWAWATVELLNLGHLLNFSFTALCWTLPLVVIFPMLLCSPSYKWPDLFEALPLNIFEKSAVISILLIMACTLILALGSPPNTWDALTYHMARVAHWAQNHSVAPYPTNILRQIITPPGEYYILNLYILGQSDAMSNMVQWCAMAGSLLTVTLIAKELGASRTGQILAAAFAVTIPMGIIESSSVQGDYVEAFFLSSSIYSLLRWQKGHSWPWACILGMSLALAVLSKTGIFFIGPILIWFLIIIIRRDFKKYAYQAMIVLCLMLAVNGGYILRNIVAFGGTKGWNNAVNSTVGVINKSIDPHIFLINILRDVTCQLGTQSGHFNAALLKGTTLLAAKCGVDINDPRGLVSTYYFTIEKPSCNENMIQSGLHLLLIIITLGVVLFPSWASTKLRYYCFCLILIALNFCLLMKWSPSVPRYELPFLVISAAAVGVLAERAKPPFVRQFIIAVLFVCAIPYVISCYPRHLIGPKSIFKKSWEERYFMMNIKRYKDFALAADQLKASRCRNIGLITGEDDWEYPLWPMLQERGMKDIRMEHIDVQGPTASLKYPLGEFHPCAEVRMLRGTVNVIDLRNEENKPKQIIT